MVQPTGDHKIKLFSLKTVTVISLKNAAAAGLPLEKLSSRQFSDGEIQINIEESVRGVDVYIIQSTSFPVNNHLLELLIMIDACKRKCKLSNCCHSIFRFMLVKTAPLHHVNQLQQN